MEFKKDDVLICVEAGVGGYLTYGKEYVTIVPVGGWLVKVLDDYGNANNFRVDRFKLKEKEVKEIKWVVGQEVWDIRFGKGVVVCVDFDDIFKIQVKFDACFNTYTTEGMYDRNDKQRSLYFSEPVISADLYPKFIPTLIGKRLMVSNGILFTIEVHGETLTHIYSKDGLSYPKSTCSFYEIGEVVKFD